MEIIFTKEIKWLESWDLFVLDNPKGSHLMLSSWLQSYNSYGFDYELGIIVKNNKIIGGCGVVIPKVLWFKFYIIPHGPIIMDECRESLKPFLKSLLVRAKEKSCCYLQSSMPISVNEDVLDYTYSNDIRTLFEMFLQPGKLFHYVYTSYGLNWVDFGKCSSADEYLEQLTPKVRRNIRMPYNKNAKAFFVTDELSIASGYELIVENAIQGNYNVRSFQEFKETIMNLVQNKRAYFLICEVNGIPKAAGLFVETKGYITNIMGGVLREKPDIKLGYMLQWEIIKKSFEKGFKGYNISMGGSLGVQDFKSKFGAETIFYENPHFHVVLNKFYFGLFKVFDKHMKPYKSRISKILSILKR